MRHSVGQTLTQAGSSLFSTRFAQKLHFSAVWVFGSMKSWSYGHASMQARQPMQDEAFRSTISSRRLKSALVGQIRDAGRVFALIAEDGKEEPLVSGKVLFSTVFTQQRFTPTGIWCSALHAIVHA